MTKSIIIRVLTLLLLLSACCRPDDNLVRAPRAIDALMDQAETIIDADAPAADSLMSLIDAASIKSKKRHARYALLSTEAQYKNYIPLTTDSLIMDAVRYYSISNNLNYRFLSFYYLGCAYMDMGQMSDASVALAQAEQLADKIDNDYWKGLLYSQLGSVFTDACEFQVAEEYYSKAESCFRIAEKDFHLVYALYKKGRTKLNQHDYSAADSILRIAENEASQKGFNPIYSDCLYYRLYCSFFLNEPDSATLLIESVIKDGTKSYDSYEFLLTEALYYNTVKDCAKADIYLTEAWNRDLSDDDSIYLYYVSSLISKSKGDYDISLEYFLKYTSLQNGRLLSILNQPITGAQRDYYRTVSELEAMKARNRVTILIASIIICLLIIAYIVLINLIHKRQTQQEIRDYLSTIDELTARDSFNQDRITSLNVQVREMLRQQFEPSDYLYTRYYEQFDDNKKAERLFRVVKTQIDQFTAPKSISRIDVLLNKTFDGIMDKMSSSGLELKEKELLLLRFVLAGFSAKSMAAILDDTHVNINQRKKRLLDKIQIKAPDLMVELRKILDLK